jgi:hypothetical protein
MGSRFRLIVLALVAAFVSNAQEAAPRFEVDSVKPARADQPPGSYGVTTKPGRLSVDNLSLKLCIMRA